MIMFALGGDQIYLQYSQANNIFGVIEFPDSFQFPSLGVGL